MKFEGPINNKTLQFELWQQCNNHCDFCYLNKQNKHTDDDVKIKSLKNALNTISNKEIVGQYNCIGFIGGEFFQGQLSNPEVKTLFFQLMEKTAQLYNTNQISQVWISATLNIGHQTELYQTLNLFENHDRVWILTSWDTVGRFKSDKMLKTWEYHMENLHKTYPNLKINTTTILTGDLIDRYNKGEFTFIQLSEKYHCTFFLKHCGSIVPWKTKGNFEELRKVKQLSNEIVANFFPKRKSFLLFLSKFYAQEPEDMRTRMFNIQYRADNLIRSYNDGRIEQNVRLKNQKEEVEDLNHLECGHPFVYSAYIDSDKCILCDKLWFENL